MRRLCPAMALLSLTGPRLPLCASSRQPCAGSLWLLSKETVVSASLWPPPALAAP